MVQTALYQHYHTLHTEICAIQPHLHQSDPSMLSADLLNWQRLLHQEIEPQLGTIADPGIQNQLRSLHTEMAKQLKLLTMDVNFLQVARQPSTIQQRQTQMGDRLQQLARYCNAALSLSKNV